MDKLLKLLGLYHILEHRPFLLIRKHGPIVVSLDPLDEPAPHGTILDVKCLDPQMRTIGRLSDLHIAKVKVCSNCLYRSKIGRFGPELDISCLKK